MENNLEPTLVGGGRYAIERRIGIGGGGAVYLAHDRLLNRWVAIKRVHSDGEDSSESEAAFREATQLASLQHPNIVTVYDFLRNDGDVFVVMEYVAGSNAEEITEPLSIDLFREFARQSLEGLAAAHAAGIVHRDIKAGNIMLVGVETGPIQVKLLDFGMAKFLTSPALQTMDHAGSLTGSIYVMSPEQLSRQPIDHRTDLYSLGCVFYQVLTLQNPFRGANIATIIAAHLQHDFLPLRLLRPDLPAALSAWVEQLFAFDKDARPADALQALRQLPPPSNPSPSNPSPSNRPAMASPLAVPPVRTKPAQSLPPDRSPDAPFYKKQRFLIPSAAALAAALLTLAILALTGNLGRSGGGQNKKPEAEKVERTTFASNERSSIRGMEGRKITIIDTVQKFEQDEKKGRYLVFKDSGPGDIMLFFDPEKTETSEWVLKKKYEGRKVRATGTVVLSDKRLLLDIASIDDLRLHTDESVPPAAN